LPVTIHFHFGLTPVAFVGEESTGAEAPPGRRPEGQLCPSLRSVRFRSASGDDVEIPAQLAVTCIGYEAVPCCTAAPANGVFANEGGKIDDGLYVVGWAKRGPSGTIPTNRAEALEVAQTIASEIPAAPEKGPADLTIVLQSRGVVWTDYAGWKRIEEAERAGACDERCRLKLLRAEEMMQAAQSRDMPPKDN